MPVRRNLDEGGSTPPHPPAGGGAGVAIKLWINIF